METERGRAEMQICKIFMRSFAWRAGEYEGGCQVEEGVSEWRRGVCRGAEHRRRWLNDTTKMSS